MRTENWKKIVAGCGMVLLAAYVGGFFEILFLRSEVCLNPLQCLYAGCVVLRQEENGQWQPWYCFWL